MTNTNQPTKTKFEAMMTIRLRYDSFEDAVTNGSNGMYILVEKIREFLLNNEELNCDMSPDNPNYESRHVRERALDVTFVSVEDTAFDVADKSRYNPVVFGGAVCGLSNLVNTGQSNAGRIVNRDSEDYNRGINIASSTVSQHDTSYLLPTVPNVVARRIASNVISMNGYHGMAAFLEKYREALIDHLEGLYNDGLPADSNEVANRR